MEQRKNSKPPLEWADSLEAIQQARLMDVTLLSGVKLTLRTVTLDELAVEDGLPGDLLEVAILDSADLLLPQMLQEVRQQRVDEAQRLSLKGVELADRIALKAIVKPDPSPELVAALDGFDKKMILEIAQRKRATDATGKVIAARVLGEFAAFRDERVGDEDGVAGGDDGGVAAVVG